MALDDTIYALSSGAGRAGVAVIRISGPQTNAVLQQMCGEILKPRRASFKSVVHPQTGDLLDQALVIWFPAPHSFTGEDVAEFHIHGGPAVVTAILEAVGSFTDTRMAEAGEFTRRAFNNDKLDLTGIEAISDLIQAETEGQRKQALRQMQGGLSDLLNGWRDRLIYILAYIEAGIDFSDEADVPEDVNQNMRENILSLKNDITAHLNDRKSGERLRNGLQVVIAGPANAGKSSLLNAMAKRDVAIVSEQAGTTRDIIDVHLDLNGFPVTISDTAGMRKTGDAVEQEGVRRAEKRINNADVVLWTTDGTRAEEMFDFEIDSDQTLIRLRNKADLDSPHSITIPDTHEKRFNVVLNISAKTGKGLDGLIEILTDIASDLRSAGESAVITRVRHREALMAVIDKLSKILDAPHQAEELIAENLRVSARELGRVTGRVDVEDLLDVIFKDFCVGK